jgi:hypothetical protein
MMFCFLMLLGFCSAHECLNVFCLLARKRPVQVRQHFSLTYLVICGRSITFSMWKVSSIMEMILPCRELLLEYKGKKKKNLGSAKFALMANILPILSIENSLQLSSCFAVKCGF